jgi:hypothetical protein
MSKPGDEITFLLRLDKLKGSLSKSFVPINCRFKLRELRSDIEHKDELFVTETLKNSARQLLNELQMFFSSSRVGILKRQRDDAQQFLKTLENTPRSTSDSPDQLPKDLWEAVEFVVQQVLPRDMKHSIVAIWRQPITVYVDPPKHENYTSTSEIAIRINNCLHAHGQKATIRVRTAENGTIFERFKKSFLMVI